MNAQKQEKLKEINRRFEFYQRLNGTGRLYADQYVEDLDFFLQLVSEQERKIESQIVEIGKLRKLTDAGRWRKEADRYRLTLKTIHDNPELSRDDVTDLVSGVLHHKKRKRQ